MTPARVKVANATLFDMEAWADKARRWIRQNPRPFDAFCNIALSYYNSQRRIGSKAIVERMRWEMERLGDGQDGFKFNNNYTSEIARQAIKRFPRLAATIKVRRRKTA